MISIGNCDFWSQLHNVAHYTLSIGLILLLEWLVHKYEVTGLPLTSWESRIEAFVLALDCARMSSWHAKLKRKKQFITSCQKSPLVRTGHKDAKNCALILHHKFWQRLTCPVYHLSMLDYMSPTIDPIEPIPHRENDTWLSYCLLLPTQLWDFLGQEGKTWVRR